MRRRTFLSVLFAALPLSAWAQTTPSAVRSQPVAGEIELRGVVQAVLVKEKRLVLDATEVTPFNGAATPIDPPRPKSILVGPKTILRDATDAGANRVITLADIKPEDTVAVVGKSAGEGKAMTARVIRTLEDPTAKRVNLLPTTADTKPWTFAASPTAKAALTADEGALKVEVTDPGDTERDVQVGKGYLDIVQGHTYQLRFRAKADAPRTLRVVSQASWPDRTSGLSDTIELGKEWKNYSLRFDVNDPSPDKDNALVFWLGQKEGTVWIADASLKDTTRRVVRPARDPLLLGLLGDLKSMDKFRRKGAADKLAAMVPIDESREAVADALIAVFDDSDLFVRWAAVAAMRVWATNDTIPALIRKLSDPEHAVRWATMDSLGALKDRRAAGPLAGMVARGQDRGFAAGAMQKMGWVSVEAAVKLLTADAWEARMEACKILGMHGGPEVVPYLQNAVRVNDGLVRGAAEDALRSASGRR